MQVFRLVQSGTVDRLIAFDELPKRLLEGVEMRPTAGLPRHWNKFVEDQEKVIPSSTFRNPITGEVQKIEEKRIVAPFFYVLFYKEINKDRERWSEICSFIKRTVAVKFRLMDNIEDMALPMSTDANSELKLEPEELEEKGALIPIPVEFQEKDGIVDPQGRPVSSESSFKCEECEKSFEKKQALAMHTYKAHGKTLAQVG